jgi:nucleoid-associated protein YgaU
MEHASLELRMPPADPNKLQAGSMIERIDFQFNPKELSVGKAAKWDRKAGTASQSCGVPQFGGSEPCKLTLEMFLDASDTQSDVVVKTFEKLLACCKSTPESYGNEKPSPPWVILRWGSLSSFTGYIASVNVKYTLFTPGGLPIRGSATVSLEEIPTTEPPPGQNPTSGALSTHRVHTVLTGDTLASIAWREYGDPAMWRTIATTNGIDDPMRLRAGSSLLIPAADALHG